MSTLPDSFTEAQGSILERVARGIPLQRSLEEIVRFIEAQAAGMRCSIVLVEAGVISDVVAPTLPSPYAEALVGLKIGPTAGSCGAAAYLGRRVIVSDIATHPNWALYRDLALPHGLRACWSTPIFGTDQAVLGTFAMYYAEVAEPRAHELEWVDVATHLASIAVLRARSEAALRRSEARARQLALLFSVSSAVNEAIVRLRDPQSIYEFACRIAVEQGLAGLAWIGSCTPDRGRIEVVARHGHGVALLDVIELDPGDEPVRQGQLERTLDTGKASLCHDIAADPNFRWKVTALRSCAVFPLNSDGAVFGVFVLYASQPGYFQDQEVAILTALAANISFGVELANAQRERQQLATQLERSQRLYSLGTLAGGIAHDFNNILAAIAGNAELALLDSHAQNGVRSHVVEIQKAARRGSDLVRQILTFGRREQPKRELIDPRSVVEEALQLLRPTLPQGVTLRMSCAGQLPQLAADSTQLHQIIMNLGTNALQAMGSGGGTIDVTLDTCVVDAAMVTKLVDLAVGSYMRIRVTDTGCGMDEATLRQAFDPFFTTKDPGKGTGLGLAVVHGIVMGHGGAIDVCSERGVGTAFTLYFPAGPGETRVVTTRQVESSESQLHVMYVDDDEMLVTLAAQALESPACHVTGFTDPLAALECFAKAPEKFDVIVTDMSMPTLPGFELAARVHRLRADIPIIVTSGYLRPQDYEMAERLSISKLVYKPNTLGEFAALLASEFAQLH